jgi:dienelactone hydrolase
MGMGELSPFEYRHQDVVMKGALALPEGPGPHPGVLVMHGAHGLGGHARERALRMAEAGYVALATDMYGDGQYFPDPKNSAAVFGALQSDPQLLRARVVAAFEALRGVPRVDARRLGAIGFCFGGQCVLELARSGADARGVVSFHGLLTTAQPARPGEVTAKVLVLAGAKDPYAPAEDIAGFQAEMDAARADWQLTVYGEGWHAFTDPDAALHDTPGVRYAPLIDRLSWAQSMAFLDAVVRG